MASPDVSHLVDTTCVPVLHDYFDFIEEQGPTVLDAQPVADIGVYFSWETALHHLAPRQQDMFANDYAIVQPLQSHGYPSYNACVELFTRQHRLQRALLNLDSDRAREVGVVVLPDTAVVTEDEAQSIRRLVRDGMGLVATGETSLYDTQGERSGYLLGDVFGVTERTREVRRHEFGKGRVVLDPGRPEMRGLWNKRTELASLLAHLDWASRRPPLLTTNAPAFIMTKVMASGDGLLLHLVNFWIGEDDRINPTPAFRVELRGEFSEVSVLSPDPTPPNVRATCEGGRTVLDVTNLTIYAMVVLRP